MGRRKIIDPPGVVRFNSDPYDPCPSCGELKKLRAKLCRGCKDDIARSPEIFETLLVDGEPCRQVPLNHGLYFIVDGTRYDEFMQCRWNTRRDKSGRHYACRLTKADDNGIRHSIAAHQQVVGIASPQVDHINHNGLDNRRSNLRPCTHDQNVRNARKRSDNTSGFKGVSFNKKREKWQAYIGGGSRSKKIHLGMFLTPEDAARAYDDAAHKSFGEFAWLNFPKANISGGV